MKSIEHGRHKDDDWALWGPYLAERAWGTVREDYSAGGDAWTSFGFDEARARAFRWNEDGLAGISDRSQYLCSAVALWNGEDPFLKERLFGLDNHQGNHGEDVKEAYWYLDATPSHAYLEMRYRYPQQRFPYDELIAENARRTLADREYELIDTGVFDEGRFFDVDVEYAKAAPDDIVGRITVHNRGPAEAVLHVLPSLWFRNTWAWGYPSGPLDDVPDRPTLRLGRFGDGAGATERVLEVVADHPALGRYHWYARGPRDLWVTDNETNLDGLYDEPGPQYTKDAFNRRLVHDEVGAVNPLRRGTKAAFWYRLELAPGESTAIEVRLSATAHDRPFDDVAEIVAARRSEADAFHGTLLPAGVAAEDAAIHRAAIAGLIWSKQLYYFDVEQWLAGDPAGPDPEPGRDRLRNGDWSHLNNFDVISMPDAWEYPWYAAWDLAFHCVPLATVDAGFAKGNLRLMTREWYMHPNGQFPAYEWEFGNVNPPVFAWATRRVFEIDRRTGGGDDEFLEGMFHKLLLNFTWWVNRKDADGNNVFQGGFLGLDNVSLFDRSDDLPTGGHIDQSDATAWMAFSTLGMLRIALELAARRPVYEAVATKFYEHFLSIARAINLPDHSLWNDEDGFFYDVLHLPDGRVEPLRVRSLVGLLPLLGVEVIEPGVLDAAPRFRERMEWYRRHRPQLSRHIASVERPGVGHRILLSVLDEDRLRSVLRYLLDPDEFLSPYGVRSLSKFHADHPYTLEVDGTHFTIGYEPGESTTALFGGNSNWRGPVWFPVNYLIIEALREYHEYYGDAFVVECPTGSGREVTLQGVADDLADRLIALFRLDDDRRPFHGDVARLQSDPAWRDLLLFHEYFDGDTGRGLGASHQTGWTALVAKLIEERHSRP